MSLQKELGVEPPLFIMLSFLGVKDYVVAFSGTSAWGEGHPIDRTISYCRKKYSKALIVMLKAPCSASTR
jgi:hypothetical protein